MATSPRKPKNDTKAQKGQIMPVDKGGRPPHDRDEYFGFIQPFLELGYSLWKACLFAEVPYMTVKDWFDQDESFRKKVIREQNKISAIARKVLADKITSRSPNAALSWLERMERDEFGNPNEGVTDGLTAEDDSIKAIEADLKGIMYGSDGDTTEGEISDSPDGEATDERPQDSQEVS